MRFRSSFLLMGVLLLALAGRSQTVQKISMAELAQYAATTDSVLVINFWATFCKPCVEEIPFMQRISRQYAGQKVKLLLVSLDMKSYYPTKVGQFIKSNKFTAPVVWLNETNADYFCPMIDKKWSGAIPATLIVNNQRKERRFYEQPFTPTEFEQELKAVIGL